MAHWCKPPNTSGPGYDVDGKLAPDSIWRMQVPLGGTRSVALWGGKDLWVKSNNPAVVPNNGFSARVSGDLTILTLSAGSAGTTMLDAGTGNSVWVTLQVQVTPGGGAAAVLHDDRTYFVKPSWSSSFTGASLTGDKRLWRQELDLGGSASVGLKGWQGMTLGFNQPRIAAHSTFVDKVNDLLGIDLVGIGPGNVEFIAYLGGKPVAAIQVFVRATASPHAPYVDNFATGYYDIDYRHEGGNYSKYLIVRYADDVVLPIHMDRIADVRQDPAAARKSIDAGSIGEGGRRFPAQMNATTTPNLVALKRLAIEKMEAATFDLIKVSKEAIIFVLFVAEAGRTMLREAFSQMARSSAPRSVRQVLESAGEGGSQQLLGKEAKAMVDELRAAGKPVAVNLGGTGEVADAINVNPLLDQQVRGIPRIIAGRAEEVGSFFEAGSVDRIVSNNIVRGQVNWSQALRGASKVLKPGGKVTIAPYAGEIEAQLAEIESALREAGFRNIMRDPITKLFCTATK